jgi:F-type H+-transporting ATPase subunit epsilon
MATLPEAIELQIVTPERHVLQENVQAVEIPGKEGYLGVLPGHAPLLTELGVGILGYRKGSVSKFVTVIQGYAEVLPDRVIVLAEISEKAEEIDVARSKTAHDRAQAELAKHGISGDEWDRQELALQRALVRMQAAARGGAGAASASGETH